MRRRGMYFAVVLGLLLAVVTPGVAGAAGTQNIQAGFSPKANAEVTFGQSIALRKKFSKKGTLRTRVFLTDILGTPPAADTVAVDFAAEGRITTKGIPVCDPALITGETTEDAIAACPDAQIGSGSDRAFDVAESGVVTAFNGPKAGGNATLLLHAFTVGFPIVLTGVIAPSPAGPQYGERLTVPVASPEGPVPPGIVITDFDTTVSKIVKKKRKRKKNRTRSYVSARCTDGTAKFQGTFEHLNFPTQVVETTQPCTLR